MMPVKIKTIWDKFVHRSLRYTHEQTQRLNLSVANAEYAQGLEFEKHNTDHALWFYLRAASHGDGNAQYKLGLSYLNSELGLPQNLAEAHKWLSLAAEQGHQDAVSLLQDIVKSPNYS